MPFRGDPGPDDRGVTFIELLVAMILFGVMIGMSIGPFTAFRLTQQHIGSTRELVAFLRRAQVRAVSEEVSYRVDLTSTGATAYRWNGSSWTSNQTLRTQSSRITFTNASFTQGESCGGTSSSICFYKRGASSRGSVRVARNGTAKTYTVTVEGLTARVSYS